MSLVNNIDKIAFASAFEIDKVYPTLYTGSFNVPASSAPPFLGNIVTEARSQLIGANVFPVMQYSTDNSTWLDMGWMKFTEGATLDTNFTATCYTTSNSLVIVGQNFTGSAQTCYYRAVLVAES